MKKVLLAGHCDIDHPRIERFLKDNFNVEVVRVKFLKDTVEFLKKEKYALAIINRIGAFDGARGIDLIKEIKTSNFNVPLMLVTNYKEHMQEAVKAGAVPGFGKERLYSKETEELLAEYLNPDFAIDFRKENHKTP